jgi:hypothetical protein
MASSDGPMHPASSKAQHPMLTTMCVARNLEISTRRAWTCLADIVIMLHNQVHVHQAEHYCLRTTNGLIIARSAKWRACCVGAVTSHVLEHNIAMYYMFREMECSFRT